MVNKFLPDTVIVRLQVSKSAVLEKKSAFLFDSNLVGGKRMHEINHTVVSTRQENIFRVVVECI